ncbi:MAG: sterol desaturase family protein [Ktedonobacterales bacterium]
MIAAFLRSDVGKAMIGFVLLALFFWLLESLWPEDRKQCKIRKGAITDTLYYFLLIPATKLISTIVLAIGIFFTLRFIPIHSVPLVAAQPGWAQGFEILLLGDLIGYWTHRAFHTWSVIWPIHAVHHSSEQLDWLSSVRVHPLDTIISRFCQTMPLFLLGFSGKALAPYALFLAIYPILLHANLAWTYGPFKYVIASPAYHRWHHAAEENALFKNYSGLFPFVDMIFGTAYFPTRKPVAYGLYQDHLSNNIFTQLLYPFRHKKQAPVAAPAQIATPAVQAPFAAHPFATAPQWPQPIAPQPWPDTNNAPTVRG